MLRPHKNRKNHLWVGESTSRGDWLRVQPVGRGRYLAWRPPEGAEEVGWFVECQSREEAVQLVESWLAEEERCV